MELRTYLVKRCNSDKLSSIDKSSNVGAAADVGCCLLCWNDLKIREFKNYLSMQYNTINEITYL